MTQIMLDMTTAAKLQQLGEPADLCDPSGQVVGRFVPPLIDLTKWEPITPDVSEEELDRREQETESYTTDEVLAYLEKLGCSESDGGAPH
jgi:hypothetical protein